MTKKGSKESVVELFEDLYHYAAGPQEMVAQVLTGHLAIEFLLRQLIYQYDPKLVSLSDELSHAKLISLSRDINNVSQKMAEVLIEINKLRNRFAHEIQYTPQLTELLTIFETASVAFSDYADGLSWGITKIKSATSVYDLDTHLLSELFLAVIYDLHQEYVVRGGDEEMPSKY